MADDNTLIGHVLDVRGDLFVADVKDDEQGGPPGVTIGDEDIAVGRIGSYVQIEQGKVHIIGMVARMTERERLGPAPPADGGDVYCEPMAIRTIEIVPVGVLTEKGDFERGISEYPTTGAEVHATGKDSISKMFKRFKEKQFAVGRLSSSVDLLVHLDPSPLFGRHCALLGQTGAGKSWTVASLLQKTVSVMPHAHIVVLDLHGEYREAFGKGVSQHVEATKLEIPYWLMTYAELCDLLVDRSEFTAHNQIAFFRETLNKLRQEEGRRLALARTTVDTPVYFSIEDLQRSIAEENVRTVQGQRGQKAGPLAGQFDRFLIRLDSRMNDVRYDFLLKPRIRTTSESLETLLKEIVGLGTKRVPITVIDVSPVPSDVRPTVTAQIGRLIYEFNYWNPSFRKFPLLLVCEEAHAYIKRESDALYEGARKSMERIAKEGRKYGVGILVVSQRPHELSETVLSQCGTFICLRLTNPDDQAYVRRLVPEAERDLVAILAGLRRGEALVLGDSAPMPSRVLIDRPNPTPASDDVDFYTQWKDGFENLDVAKVVDRWRRQDRKPEVDCLTSSGPPAIDVS